MVLHMGSKGGKFVLKPDSVVSRLKKFKSCCACEMPSALVLPWRLWLRLEELKAH